ncbi:MAG TPA: MFS transporter [Gaiellaceae bacterium]|nr:MFS transporter [Gaiellaceae bacterium]
MRYRWVVLAAGTVAVASGAALFVTGLPVLAPTLQSELDLSLGEIGVLLAAAWVGSTLALLPWGLAADRFGERIALSLGLGMCSCFLVAAAFATSFWPLFLLLALAGAAGSSVNSASGRAVMQWFAPSERGLALGIRQSAIPAGGLIGALVVPALAAADGSKAAFLFLAGFCAFGALIGAIFLRRGSAGEELDSTSVVRTLADAKLWRLCLGSGVYLYAQLALIGFAVVFLHEEHGVSASRAALVVAVAQVFAAGLRIAIGRWSDLLGSRVRPLRLVGLAVAASLTVIAALADGPLWLLVAGLAIAGGLSMAWNGLSFAAAAELAGLRRSGAAIGFQQTVLSGIGVVAPPLFAATVTLLSWPAAFLLAALFPAAGWLALRPLEAH